MSDDPIRPDGVSRGGDPPGDESGGALDLLAERAVDSVLHLVRRGNALAGGVLLFTVVCSIGGFLLGYAALSGGMQTVWIVLGGFFAVVAIGSVVRSMLRLRSVRRNADQLVTEVRGLIGGDRETRSAVRDTVDSTESRRDDGISDLSREFFVMQTTIGGRGRQFPALASALSAVTSFPGFIALATLVSFVFGALSVIFAISLLL